MRYIRQFTIVLAALNILSCGGKPISMDDDYQGLYHWSGTIVGVGTSNYWTINCYSDCDSCFATDIAHDHVKLDKKKHKPIFDHCLTLPAGAIVDDSTDTVVTPMGEVEFKQSDSLFGMDTWRTCRGNDHDINYRSIAAGSHADVNIILTDGIRSAFNKIVAILVEPGSQNYLSFSDTTNKDTVILHMRWNYVTIYANAATPDGATVEVKVLGITDPKQPACLAGDCQGSGDRLQIVVYHQKTLSDNHLYYVNNPEFRPADTVWKRKYNKVLQQAVVKLDTFYTHIIADTAWDLNRNGFVDIPVNLGMYEKRTFSSFPDTIYNELAFIIPTTNKCSEDSNSSSFILKKPIYAHYILSADADSGDTILYFETVEGLIPGQVSLKLGRFYETDSLENLVIISVDKVSNAVQIDKFGSGKKGIERRYNVVDAITARTGELIKGITPLYFNDDPVCKSCSFITSSASDNMNTYIHEYLHQKKNGALKHVGDDVDSLESIDNIMYPFGSRSNNLLRYRRLNAYHRSSDNAQHQWDQIRQ